MREFSTYLTTAYSLIDIGPIVNGETRAANQVSAYSRVGRPSYRSLHTNVPIVCTAGQLEGQVIITHLLQSAQISVYATPITDPFDPAFPYGADDTIRTWYDTPAAGTVVLHAARSDGAVFAATQTMRYDVMVCVREPIAGDITPVATILGPHHSVQHPPFGAAAQTGDYGALDRVAAPRPVTPAGSYMAQYSNVQFGVAPGINLAHNLGGVARIVLFGPTVANPGANYQYVIDRALTANTSSIAEIGGAGFIANRCDVAVLRNYSRHIPA